MSYVDPRKNINRYLESKPRSSYPESVEKEILLLSLSKDNPALPFGSYLYRLQKYPGDVDLLESFISCCDVETVSIEFSKALQRVIKKIKKEKTHYYSEVKAGLDLRFDIDIGQIENGKYIPHKELGKKITKLYNERLIEESEYKIIKFILLKQYYTLVPLNGDDYDIIFYIIRQYRILRWSEKEILNGKIKLFPNISLKLKDAVKMKTPVKIDEWALINGRFVEVTNFIELAYEDDNGETRPINISIYETNAVITLKDEIEKLYFSDMYYSPFKAVKRMFAFLRRTYLDSKQKDAFYDLLLKVIPFVSSNTSLLYQLKSELETILSILERVKSPPKKSIEIQLDEMKTRIVNDLELDIEAIEIFNKYINDINKIDTGYGKIKYLNELIKILKKVINRETIIFLEKNGMNPPPSILLPAKRKYANIIRGPYDDPQNPLKKIIEEMKKPRILPDVNLEFLEEEKLPNYEIPLKTKKSVKFGPSKESDKKYLEKLRKQRIKKIKKQMSEDFDIPIEEITDEEVKKTHPELINFRPSETKRPISRNKLLVLLELQKIQKLLFNLNGIDIEEYGHDQSAINDVLFDIYESDPELRKNIKKAIQGKTIAAGYHKNYIAEGEGDLFQTSANIYRKYFCNGKARQLLPGEYHYGCHNFTGPGTRIDLPQVLNYAPYNDIDACSRQHDIDYSNAQGNPHLIREADKKVLQCYDKYPNENGYNVAKLGINAKMNIENALPLLVKSVAPNYFGQGCDTCPEGIMKHLMNGYQNRINYENEIKNR